MNEEGWEGRTAGRTEPSWFADAQQPRFAKLDRDVAVDVAVVGAGISGITAAYLLAKAGKQVVAVIDDGNIASGETGRTTAHITCALDDRYYNLEKMHGKGGARLAAQSHGAAIDAIESIVREEGIDCDFERLDGYLFLDPTDKKESLQKELDATHRAGIATELLDSIVLNSDVGPCLRFPNQGTFQPLKYIAGVAGAIARNGGQIYAQTHAENISSAGVKTDGGCRISAHKIIIATNAPIIDKISRIYDKQDACRTYAIAARIDKAGVPNALYWDTGNQESDNPAPPYHYVRIQKMHDRDYDLLIAGGEDHPTGITGAGDRHAALEAWARSHFPIGEVEYRWSGQVLEPRDSLAFIGRNPRDRRKNIFIATGDSGNGITHGTIAGMILSDLIMGKKNPWARLYSPSRKMPKAKRDEPDGKKKKQQRDPGELEPGQGMVVEGKKPLACHRDEKGALHSYSAVCTHLGCTVQWNGLEKSFDCPCHGSRFSYAGRAVNGPANYDLRAKKG